jgi:hypothetical protein
VVVPTIPVLGHMHDGSQQSYKDVSLDGQESEMRVGSKKLKQNPGIASLLKKKIEMEFKIVGIPLNKQRGGK